MRALRQRNQRLYNLRVRTALAARTKGLWMPDDPECIRCVMKRNHCETTGRRRESWACPARRLKAEMDWKE